MRTTYRRRRQRLFITWIVLGCAICWMWSGQTPAFSGNTADQRFLMQTAQQPPSLATEPLALETLSAEERGRVLHESGAYGEAIVNWQQALQIYRTQNNHWGQARIFSNLALAYQKVGQWSEAAQAMDNSLKILPDDTNISTAQIQSRAQVLTNHGIFQLHQGQAEEALLQWQRAEKLYQQMGDMISVIQIQLNQVEALYEQGFYRRAVDSLAKIQDSLIDYHDSSLHVIALRRLGSLLRVVGQLDQSRQVLTQSLTMAQTLTPSEETGETLISLAKTAQAQQDLLAAERYYQQLDRLSLPFDTQLRSQLAKLGFWVVTGEQNQAELLAIQILQELKDLPASHTVLYSQIHLIQTLGQLYQQDPNAARWRFLAQLAAQTAQQAQTVGNQRAEAYALGLLGNVYEHVGQLHEAVDVTQRALVLTRALNASDIAYQWQWQLGRILKQQGKREDAIAAYTVSVNLLQTLRGDLVATHSDLQFSFQESIEPIYRELVDLLLTTASEKSSNEAYLEQARDVIESLQLAELDDFFKEACLDVHPIQIDKIDPQAAIFYPILLEDRLEIILRLPHRPLYHYSASVSKASIESLTQQLRESLVIRSRRDYLSPSQQLYDWIIRPVAADLKNSGATTLVFIPDRPLQSIPMGALHDGKHFLIEDYNIALTPGLKLLFPQPISRDNIQILAAGLTEGRQGFAPLSHVALEMDAIQSNIPRGEVLLDQAFTRASLKKELQFSDFPIVHIATHGQFSSTAEETFILSWDNRINVMELDQALRTSSLSGDTAIELLVLSACETARGDKQAALGIAGTAVKAGARSTLATLWSVNDEATANLIGYFYETLMDSTFTRAEALRQAQLKLLQDPQYRHPVYWAPYILLGNWL